MKLEELLETVGDEPLFETGLLLAGDVDPARRAPPTLPLGEDGAPLPAPEGLYAVAPPFQRVYPHPFLVANRLVPGSYDCISGRSKPT